jgi:hypothetical protein
MGTLPAWWTDPYPEVRSTKTATDYLDGLGAALNRREEDGGWVLSTGDQELITAGTNEELDSFVLGFALAHLICERHGPIGERTGPTRLPHPAELEDRPGASTASSDEPASADDEGAGEGGGASEASVGEASVGEDGGASEAGDGGGASEAGDGGGASEAGDGGGASEAPEGGSAREGGGGEGGGGEASAGDEGEAGGGITAADAGDDQDG